MVIPRWLDGVLEALTQDRFEQLLASLALGSVDGGLELHTRGDEHHMTLANVALAVVTRGVLD